MVLDAAETSAVRRQDALRHYCDCVRAPWAGCPTGSSGSARRRATASPGALGEALQLTNILRDVHEDAERDRLYLPADLLARHGVPSGALPDVLAHHNLAPACAELAETAERRLPRWTPCSPPGDRRQMRPAVMIMEVYRRVFRRLVHRGWRRLAEPVTLSKLEKFWVLLRHGMV